MSNISVQLVDSMGNDKRVAEVARISFANDNLDIPEEITAQDLSLINFLARGVKTSEYDAILNALATGVGNREAAVKMFESIKHQATHWTPFAHTAFTLKCSAPIPIRTQLFKHTIGLVANEESRRYIDSTPEIFIPEQFRARPDGSIKQGSGGVHKASDSYQTRYMIQCNKALALYDEMIIDGISPEQARLVLPQGAMVNWVWTGNIVALANVYNKRIESHAQQEVQDFARKLKDAVEPIMPIAWAALTRSQV